MDDMMEEGMREDGAPSGTYMPIIPEGFEISARTPQVCYFPSAHISALQSQV